MSIDATRWAWKQTGVSSTEKLVLLSMADRAGENHQCWPSIARLCLDTGLSERSVQNVIRTLADRGFIQIVERPSRSNMYILMGVSGREDKNVKNTDADSDKGAARAPRKTCTPQGMHPAADAPPNHMHPAKNAAKGCSTCGVGVQEVHPNLSGTQKNLPLRACVGPEGRTRKKKPALPRGYIPAHEIELTEEQLEKNRAAARRHREQWQQKKCGQQNAGK